MHFPNEPKPDQDPFFFFEADRATEPIERMNLSTNSFYKEKMVKYYESYDQKLFEKNYGSDNARVLTVTKSLERAENMIEVSQEIDYRGKGLRMFLFAPKNAFDLNQPGRVFEKVWLNGRGEEITIID